MFISAVDTSAPQISSGESVHMARMHSEAILKSSGIKGVDRCNRVRCGDAYGNAAWQRLTRKKRLNE